MLYRFRKQELSLCIDERGLPLYTECISPGRSAAFYDFRYDPGRSSALLLPFLYLLCDYRAAIQGMGNALIPMYSGFLELIMCIGTTLLLPLLIGQKALYFTDAAAWVVTMGMLLACYRYLCRKNLR